MSPPPHMRVDPKARHYPKYETPPPRLRGQRTCRVHCKCEGLKEEEVYYVSDT